MATTTPDEINGILKEFMAYEEKTARAEGSARVTLPDGGRVQAHRAFVATLGKFHEKKMEENCGNALSFLGQLDEAAGNLQPALSTGEIKGFTQKLRDDLGVIPRLEFESVYQKHLQELLDDSNQDRIDKILARIRKLKNLSGSSESGIPPRANDPARRTGYSKSVRLRGISCRPCFGHRMERRHA